MRSQGSYKIYHPQTMKRKIVYDRQLQQKKVSIGDDVLHFLREDCSEVRLHAFTKARVCRGGEIHQPPTLAKIVLKCYSKSLHKHKSRRIEKVRFSFQSKKVVLRCNFPLLPKLRENVPLERSL